MSIAFEAMIFAMEVHKNQKRKYTNNPYSDHLAEVAGIVATISNRIVGPKGIHFLSNDPEVIAVAWLHDCMEDCNVQYQYLHDNFGKFVATGVLLLSDLEEGNRAERKKLSRERLSKAINHIQNIKVADLISNTSSIVQHDPKFAKVYLEEKRLLLDVLTSADERLVKIARNICEEKA